MKKLWKKPMLVKIVIPRSGKDNSRLEKDQFNGLVKDTLCLGNYFIQDHLCIR
jgi:hypothetical protein